MTNKRVLILQGIPGSGKSTFARELHGSIVSADHFFEKDGRYEFDGSKIGLAHQQCFHDFMIRMLLRIPLIIVDNTNTSPEEINPYYLAAEAFGYTPEILFFPCEVSTALIRNIHGVREEVVQALYNRLEKFVPLPWWTRKTYPL